MREYETVFILHPQVDEAGVEREIEAVKKTIEEGQGEVTGVHKWPRRRLAYTIRKVNEGTYTLIRFRSGPEVLKELDRKYKINESVLRHLTLHAHGDPVLRDHPRDRRGGRPGAGPRGRGRGFGREGRERREGGEPRSEESGPESDPAPVASDRAAPSAAPHTGADQATAPLSGEAAAPPAAEPTSADDARSKPESSEKE